MTGTSTKSARTMAKSNAFYAQSGGVTAVINASAAGVIETARAHRTRIGTRLRRTQRHHRRADRGPDRHEQGTGARDRALMHTPAGAFGSCRYKLKGLDENRAQYERLIDVFRAHDIGYFFYNGGNDSADTCLKVSQIAGMLGYPLTAVHVPKTVDNDLAVTDNCPGFGSVAKYVATSMREAAFDVASMARTSTKVFVLEVMGRHAGLDHRRRRPRRRRWRHRSRSCCCFPKSRSTKRSFCASSMSGRSVSAIAASAFRKD